MNYIRFITVYRDPDDMYYDGDALNIIRINIYAVSLIEYDIKGDIGILHTAISKNPFYISGDQYRALKEEGII